MGFVGAVIFFGIQTLSGNIYLNLFLFNVVGIPTKVISNWTQNRYWLITSQVTIGILGFLQAMPDVHVIEGFQM